MKTGEFCDISGQRFGKLTAIRNAGIKHYPSGGKLTLWECKCDCGNTTIVSLSSLRTGNTRTCGCSHYGRNCVLGNITRKHGKTGTRLYVLWKQIRKRCRNPNSNVYKYYGGKGVKVCEEWNSFEAFEKWAIENGYDESAERGKCTIDRIDPYGDYSPDNCRWITIQEQQHNKRRDMTKVENSV